MHRQPLGFKILMLMIVARANIALFIYLLTVRGFGAECVRPLPPLIRPAGVSVDRTPQPDPVQSELSRARAKPEENGAINLAIENLFGGVALQPHAETGLLLCLAMWVTVVESHQT